MLHLSSSRIGGGAIHRLEGGGGLGEAAALAAPALEEGRLSSTGDPGTRREPAPLCQRLMRTLHRGCPPSPPGLPTSSLHGIPWNSSPHLRLGRRCVGAQALHAGGTTTLRKSRYPSSHSWRGLRRKKKIDGQTRANLIALAKACGPRPKLI